MNEMRHAIATAALLISACLHAENGHLTPQVSMLSAPRNIDYYASVARVFSGLDRATLKVIALPSFSNEYAVALFDDGDDCRIFHAVTEYHLWASYDKEHENNVAFDPFGNSKQFPLVVSVRKLEKEKCMRLQDAWRAVVFNTRYRTADEEKHAVMDGATYYFSARGEEQGYAAGETTSPLAVSDPGKLVSLSNAMGAFASDLNASDSEMMRTVALLEGISTEKK